MRRREWSTRSRRSSEFGAFRARCGWGMGGRREGVGTQRNGIRDNNTDLDEERLVHRTATDERHCILGCPVIFIGRAGKGSTVTERLVAFAHAGCVGKPRAHRGTILECHHRIIQEHAIRFVWLWEAATRATWGNRSQLPKVHGTLHCMGDYERIGSNKR